MARGLTVKTVKVNQTFKNILANGKFFPEEGTKKCETL